jgi:hypothetical protein
MSGICSTGAWFIIENFTYLNAEYLSIIATQFSIIKKALI